MVDDDDGDEEKSRHRTRQEEIDNKKETHIQINVCTVLPPSTGS